MSDEDDTQSVQEGLLEYWEDSRPGNTFDVGLEDITTITTVYVDDNGTYSGYRIFNGDFDFKDVEEQLERGDLEEETYRDFPLWQHESGTATFVLFEDDDVYVAGPDDLVKDVVRDLARGEGFIDDQTNMGRALQAAGTGIWTTASTNCKGKHYHIPHYANIKDLNDSLPILTSFPTLLTGRETNATTITGGQENLSRAAMAIIFNSGKRAETGLEDLKGYMEDLDTLDIDVDDARLDEDLITVELTMYQ